MTAALFKRSMHSQLRSALMMMTECIRKCPDKQWESAVGTMPFWMVAYHALCWTDLYLAKSLKAWKPDKVVRGGPPSLHPKGRKELWDEFPSRKFERDELLRYAAICERKLAEALAAETAKSLAGPSGFKWITGPRAETYLYNLRHLAHHGGQLSAFLWRAGVATKWVKDAHE